MPRTTTAYVCRECGGDTPKWAGQCPHCRAWNTLEEFAVRPAARQARGAGVGAPPARPLPLPEVDASAHPRLVLEWAELNRVLGGGLVAGSLVLVGGEPGVGKSTLLMHVGDQVARAGGTVLYASGEESPQQVRMRAVRLGALHPNFLVLADNDLDAIIGAITAGRPAVAIVDSVQTVSDASVEAAPGSVTQVREAAMRLMRVAKESGVPVVLVGHVTKEGAIAGPRVLEHMVDAVLYLEGERRQELRVLRANKNRFGSAEEIGLFAMGDSGLVEVPDPSALLVGERPLSVPGTAIVPLVEGSRPMLVEVQALVSATQAGFPRRVANGLDANRLFMLVAVLEKRARLPLAQQDVLVNAAGGVRVAEPAADLGLALAIAGSARDAALGEGVVVVGEIGLTGDVRRVAALERRLAEAARRGFHTAIAPVLGGSIGRPPGLRVIEVRDVREAIESAFPAQMEPAANRGPAASRGIVPLRDGRVEAQEEE